MRQQPPSSDATAAQQPPATQDACASSQALAGDEPAAVVAAVLVPTYNNARTLQNVVERIFTSCDLPVIIVNDGSTDATAAILQTLIEAQPARLTVETHDVNRGKAAALMTGFQLAAARGFTHVITLDSDDQLRPEEIPRLYEKALAQPQALIVGCRDAAKADYPAKSRIGRLVSNALIWLESHCSVGDSQCGFRVYPLGLIEAVPCRSGHFGFEAEIITRARWAGCPMAQEEVTCRYLPPGQRVSHFKPGLDSLRALALHAQLLLRALIPLPTPQWPPRPRNPRPRNFRPPNDSQDDPPEGPPDDSSNGKDEAVQFAPPAGVPMWRLWSWVSPMQAWRQLRQGTIHPMRMAMAVAVGVFIGCSPLWGMHVALSLLAAHRLRLHPLAVLAGMNISFPPMSVVLMAISICIGHWLLHGQLPLLNEINIQTWQHLPWLTTAGYLILDWALGSIILGSVMATIAFALFYLLLRLVPARAVA